MLFPRGPYLRLCSILLDALQIDEFNMCKLVYLLDCFCLADSI